MTVELSVVKPDFEDLVAQLRTVLSNKDSWKDLYISSTGQTIIEFVAAIGAFSQYNVESTFQELFLDTAKLDSSIYAITRMLGVRMTRKLPAHATVVLGRTNASQYVEIAALSQFSSNKGAMFNRDAFSFAQGQHSIEVVLYEGIVKKFTGTGTGEVFQSFLSPEALFTVSDIDVRVSVNNIPIPVVPEGLWHHGHHSDATYGAVNIVNITRVGSVATVVTVTAHNLDVGSTTVIANSNQNEYNGSHIVTSIISAISFTYNIAGTPVSPATTATTMTSSKVPVTGTTSDPAVQDTTTPNGQLDLFFGNNAFGTMPGSGAPVEIVYATTTGATGNNIQFAGTKIVLSSNSSIAGESTTALVDGADEHSAEVYRKISPLLFAAGERAVTRNDYEAIAFNYPGVLDANILGQRDLAPANVRWMNLVRISLVTSTPWDTTAWNDFINWYRKRTMYSTVFYRYDAIPRSVDVTASVFCFSTTDLDTMRNSAIQALVNLFAPRRGIIGLNIFKSDIIKAVQTSHTGVDYIRLEVPEEDVFMHISAPVESTCTVLPEGYLKPSTYVYYISSLTALGETLPVSSTAITLTTTGSVRVEWSNVGSAVGFRVYGRTKGLPGLLFTQQQNGSDMYSYIDTGLSLPSQAPPDTDTSGLYYPTLGTVTISTQYTDRHLVERPEV